MTTDDRLRSALVAIIEVCIAHGVGEPTTWPATISGIARRALAAQPSPERGSERSDYGQLPERIVVGANGAYWRDYGDHYSMCPVSHDNDPVEVVAVYVREPSSLARAFSAAQDAIDRTPTTAAWEALWDDVDAQMGVHNVARDIHARHRLAIEHPQFRAEPRAEGLREALLLAVEEVDNAWHDEGDHIEYHEELAERLITLRREYAALDAEPETPTAKRTDTYAHSDEWGKHR